MRWVVPERTVAPQSPSAAPPARVGPFGDTRASPNDGRGRLVVYLDEGCIVIEPAVVENRLVRRGRGLACIVAGELPVLTTEEVRTVLEASRR